MTVCNKFQTTASPAGSDDVVLWNEMRIGNHDALAQLYRSYLPSLQKHGMYVCKDRELVSDCIHELFSRLWTRRDHICPAFNVKVYLYRSLERIILTQLFRSKKRSTYTFAEDLSSESFEQHLIDGELRKERLDEIKKCLRSLPKCQREVIFLKFFNDLTYLEISEIMNLQLASVYNLTSKAIEHLRQKMQFHAIAAS
jgi:RNA polymerase sigma factor (sigma-70 family)